jgi:hypothetical protein
MQATTNATSDHERFTTRDRGTLPAVLPDGSYDVFVVDASPAPSGAGPEPEPGGWQLELTIVTGEHKGDVVNVNAFGLGASEFDLIGMPGTLRVEAGEPRFHLDD